MDRKNVVLALIVLAAFAVPSFAGGSKDGTVGSADVPPKGLVASVDVVSTGGASGRVLTEFVKLTKDDLPAAAASQAGGPNNTYAVKFTLFRADRTTEVTSADGSLSVVVRYALPGGAKKSDQLNHGIWVGVRKAAGGKGTDWYLAAPGKSGKKDPANNPPPELSYKLDEDPEGFAVLTFTSWPKGDPLIWGD